MNDAPYREIEDLLGAYALDAVTGEERSAVERAIESDPVLRAEVDDYRTVAALLAEAVDPTPSTPSPAVWEGIRAGISGIAAVDGEPSPLTPLRQLKRQRFFTWTLAAVTGLAVVAALGLGLRVADLEERIDTIENTDSLTVALEETLADPWATIATLTQPDGAGAASVSVVLGTDGIGYVFADNLPALTADRTYQLWAIVDGRVISAGVLGSDPEVSPFQMVGNVEGLAVTEEIAGGVVSSENDAVAVWLDA